MGARALDRRQSRRRNRDTLRGVFRRSLVFSAPCMEKVRAPPQQSCTAFYSAAHKAAILFIPKVGAPHHVAFLRGACFRAWGASPVNPSAVSQSSRR